MGMQLDKKTFEEKKVNYVLIQTVIWSLILFLVFNLFTLS